MNKRKIYYNGKCYNRGTSDVLCKVTYGTANFFPLDDIVETLYITKKGVFFLTKDKPGTETSITVLTRDEVLNYINQHPAGVDTDVYDRYLGIPDEA